MCINADRTGSIEEVALNIFKGDGEADKDSTKLSASLQLKGSKIRSAQECRGRETSRKPVEFQISNYASIQAKQST